MKFLIGTVLVFTMSLLSLWFAGFIWFNAQLSADIETMQVNQQNLPKADAIVVLTGSPERIAAGMDLYADRAAPILFISGVHEKVTIDDIIQLWAANPSSLPDCCIELGYTAENTQGNALETIRWIKNRNDIESIYLVTADYHMERAKLEFSFVKKDLKIYAYPVSSIVRQADFTDFMHIMLKEYHKTIATYVRQILLSSPS